MEEKQSLAMKAASDVNAVSTARSECLHAAENVRRVNWAPTKVAIYQSALLGRDDVVSEKTKGQRWHEDSLQESNDNALHLLRKARSRRSHPGVKILNIIQSILR